MHWVSMLGLSIPTIAMMFYALWKLMQGPLSGLTLDEILRQPPQKEAPPAAPHSTVALSAAKAGGLGSRPTGRAGARPSNISLGPSHGSG